MWRVVPLVQIAPNDWLLELFHGPTLAFKDVAMQLIGQLFEASLKRSRQADHHRRGDRAATPARRRSRPSAAREGVEVFILFPDGRVSEVQRRQMTTPSEANVHALAIAGDFDDAQARLKDMFNDHAFRDGVGLAGVNSINWARVLAQTVYYFTAAVALGAPHRKVSFTVPTGNFGDVFAGYVAKRMGLPIDRLVIAHQPERHPAPDDRDRRVPPRRRCCPRSARRWTSRSARTSSGCSSSSTTAKGAAVAALMGELAGDGGFRLSQGALDRLRADFDSARASEEETARRDRGDAARDRRGGLPAHRRRPSMRRKVRRGDPAVPMVVLATAHAAKFPDAVEAACGVRPALPPRMADLMTRPERVTRVRERPRARSRT